MAVGPLQLVESAECADSELERRRRATPPRCYGHWHKPGLPPLPVGTGTRRLDPPAPDCQWSRVSGNTLYLF